MAHDLASLEQKVDDLAVKVSVRKGNGRSHVKRRVRIWVRGNYG